MDNNGQRNKLRLSYKFQWNYISTPDRPGKVAGKVARDSYWQLTDEDPAPRALTFLFWVWYLRGPGITADRYLV